MPVISCNSDLLVLFIEIQFLNILEWFNSRQLSVKDVYLIV
jgi:hypothetical protein